MPSALLALVFLLISFLLSPVFAQPLELFRLNASLSPAATTESKQTYGDVTLGKDYFRDSAYDLYDIVTSPARWDRKDWLIAGGVIGTTVGFYFLLDRPVQNWAQDHKNGTAGTLAAIGNGAGNELYVLPALGVFYAYGAVADDSKAKRTALLAMESWFIASAITTTLKYATHRSRPADGNSPSDWDGPSAQNSDLSFCSGHSSTAFSIATVIATEYKDTPFVPYVAYGLAALTPFARIHDGAHWASDAFLGSAIGYFTAKAVMALHQKKSNVQITPMMGGKSQGLAISFEF